MSFDIGVDDSRPYVRGDETDTTEQEIKTLVDELKRKSCLVMGRGPSAPEDYLNRLKEQLDNLKTEESDRKTTVDSWKTCPVTFGPLNTRGTCTIDSLLFAFIYPPAIRDNFKAKVQATNHSEISDICNQFLTIADTVLPQSGGGISATPVVPCLKDFSKRLANLQLLPRSEDIFQVAIGNFLTVFNIPVFYGIQHLFRQYRKTPDVYSDEKLLVVKHLKEDVVVARNLFPPTTMSTKKRYVLRSVVISQGPPRDHSSPNGHAMALVSCSGVDDPSPRWHFYNGQNADTYAQGTYKDFTDAFLRDYRDLKSSEIPFGVTYRGASLNVYDENVSAYLVYVYASEAMS